jgi:hypothetical protein
MTTGQQTIHLVSGRTISYTLDCNERIAEALGEVPAKTNLVDVMSFGVAALSAVAHCNKINLLHKSFTIFALRNLLNYTSKKHSGISFF